MITKQAARWLVERHCDISLEVDPARQLNPLARACWPGSCPRERSSLTHWSGGTNLPHHRRKPLQRPSSAHIRVVLPWPRCSIDGTRSEKWGKTLCRGGILPRRGSSMRKLLSLIALSCAMAIAFGAYAPRASAAVLTTGVAALSGEQTSSVQKAYYRCWWRDGYRQCGYRHHRRHYGYWRHHRYGHHYGWRHRYWRDRYWRWRHAESDSDEHDYTYRRHYYYNSYSSYVRPTYRRRTVPAYGYCIGLCWW